jgi:signal transduction histidine kinase
MTITTVRSGSVVFQPRARLLKLIGAELISDDVVAVVELVKNAYDADASRVVISFQNVMTAGGTITIADDGVGMDLDTVLGVWMEPGATSKVEGTRRTAGRRRRVLGEKGVGRFAADKLGRRLELVSRRAGAAVEVRVVLDFDLFDSGTEMLSAIRSHWEVAPASTIERRGTVLTITGLRTLWTERMFRRLATRLARLCSPFRQLDDFVIRLESDELPDYSGELSSGFLDNAPHSIEAAFDGTGSVQIRLGREPASSRPWIDARPLSCGPVRARIFAFDLETEALGRVGPRLDVRAWLREWSGVSVYRDGFRIWPYGEPHDDWLRLDQRRVNNPVVRLSNNQVVGFVEIGSDQNPELRDQTNREGLLHNEAFVDLRRFLLFVLETLEGARQAIRHPGSGRGEERLPARPITGRNGHGQIPKPSLTGGVSVRHAGGWSELAAAGQAATLASRAVLPLLGQVQAGVTRLRHMLNGNGSAASRRLLDRLDDHVRDLETRLHSVAAMHPQTRSSSRTIDVAAELARAQELLRPLMEDSGVTMKVGVRGARLLRVDMRPESFQHLLHILVRNSLDWLQGRQKSVVRITARPRGELCELIVADNGPGIPRRIGDRVFEPLFSARDGGHGMGLAVARALIEAHRGEIGVIHDGRRPGAAFRILLPRKRSRTTVVER